MSQCLSISDTSISVFLSLFPLSLGARNQRQETAIAAARAAEGLGPPHTHLPSQVLHPLGSPHPRDAVASPLPHGLPCLGRAPQRRILLESPMETSRRPERIGGRGGEGDAVLGPGFQRHSWEGGGGATAPKSGSGEGSGPGAKSTEGTHLPRCQARLPSRLSAETRVREGVRGAGAQAEGSPLRWEGGLGESGTLVPAVQEQEKCGWEGGAAGTRQTRGGVGPWLSEGTFCLCFADSHTNPEWLLLSSPFHRRGK